MSRKRRMLYAGAAALAAMLSAVALLASPMFHITEINVRGNARVTDEEIIERMGIRATTNLVFFRAGRARERLAENFFIAGAEFRRALPGTLNVEIDERRLMAYLEHMGMYLYLDDFGRVLDIRSYRAEPRPLIVGLQLDRFQFGETIEVPRHIALNAIVHYSLLLHHHGLTDQITHINVSDTSNIRILVGYWEFSMGDVMRAEDKIMHMKAMLGALPDRELMRGFTDLRNLDSQLVFGILQ